MTPQQGAKRRKGQPVWVLAAVLFCWIGGRAMLWQAPVFADHMGAARHGDSLRWAVGYHHRGALLLSARAGNGRGGAGSVAPSAQPPQVVSGRKAEDVPRVGWMAALPPAPAPSATAQDRDSPLSGPGTLPLADDSAPPGPAWDGGERHGPRASRWSGDGWLVVRRGGNRVGAGSAPYGPTYGANQVGAVLRYAIEPGDSHRLAAYLRGYGALNGTGEREAAVGLAARLIPAVPLVAMGEMRVGQGSTGATHIRPAGSVVTQLAPFHLSPRLVAETYVQAGFVGGPGHTPFVDGQMRVDRIVEHLGRADVRLGLGAWGGAQQGAERFDIGPTLRVSMAQGAVGMRVAVDWRVRVEGNAAPTSGPALTLSAGF